MKKPNAAGRMAFCGTTAALAVVILLAGAIIPTAEIALPALAGLLMMPVVVELGKGAALSTYATVAVLSLLLVPSWEPKLLFVAFFGYYPVIKAVLESHLKRLPEWLCKLAVFNTAVIGSYALMLWLKMVPADAFTVAGVSLPWAFLAAGNVIFILYDIGLTRVITLYVAAFSPRLRRLFKF